MYCWDFPGGLEIKNSPANSGDMSSMPGQETKISHAAGQLSPCSTAGEATVMGTVHHDERAAPLTTETARAATKTQHSHKSVSLKEKLRNCPENGERTDALCSLRLQVVPQRLQEQKM